MAPAETVLGGTITASAVSVFIINLFKNAKWFPWLSAQSKVAARLWALALSAAAAAGIDVTFLHGTLTITGLTLTGILTAGWMWLKSFAVQEWIYQSTKQAKPNGNGAAPAGLVGAGSSTTGIGTQPQIPPATKSS